MECIQLEKYASESINMYWEIGKGWTPTEIYLVEQLHFLVVEMTFVLHAIYSVVLFVKSTYKVLLHLESYMQYIFQSEF